MEKHCGNCDNEYYCLQKWDTADGDCPEWRPDFYAREELEKECGS